MNTYSRVAALLLLGSQGFVHACSHAKEDSLQNICKQSRGVLQKDDASHTYVCRTQMYQLLKKDLWTQKCRDRQGTPDFEHKPMSTSGTDHIVLAKCRMTDNTSS